MTRMRPLTLILALALSLAACGGDGVSDPGNGTPDLGNTDSGNATLPPGGVGNIPGISDECAAYADLSFAMSSVFTGGFDGLGEGLVAQLPAEGRADGTIIVTALQDFTDGLAAAGIDLSQGGIASMSQEQLQIFSDLSDSVFTDEVNDAFDRLSDLVAAECAVGS